MDVTEILIEAWGAGGGGANGGGSGAGGYAKAIFAATPGESLEFTVGSGGIGVLNELAQDATDGGTSSVVGLNFVQIAAFGGKSATNVTPGAGGVYSIGTCLSATAKSGESGYQNVFTPFFDSWDKLAFGSGGQSPFSDKNFGHGELKLTRSTSFQREPGSSGSTPRGGGFYGHKGSNGYIIVIW